MGKTIGPWVEYKCFNACRQEGCPRHRVREVFHRSVDVICYEFSTGENRWFDLNEWEAIKRAAEMAEQGEVRRCDGGEGSSFAG